MAASSNSLLPVLFSIFAARTHPVFWSISITTMPRPVGRRPVASLGYRGCGRTMARALAFDFAGVDTDEFGACATATQMDATMMKKNNRGFIGLTRIRSATAG